MFTRYPLWDPRVKVLRRRLLAAPYQISLAGPRPLEGKGNWNPGLGVWGVVFCSSLSGLRLGFWCSVCRVKAMSWRFLEASLPDIPGGPGKRKSNPDKGSGVCCSCLWGLVFWSLGFGVWSLGFGAFLSQSFVAAPYQMSLVGPGPPGGKGNWNPGLGPGVVVFCSGPWGLGGLRLGFWCSVCATRG